MANMCGGRAMQPNLRNVPFVIDPFAFKKVDAVLATHYHQDHMSAEWAAHVINSGMTTTDETEKKFQYHSSDLEIRRIMAEMGSSSRPLYHSKTWRFHQDQRY